MLYVRLCCQGRHGSGLWTPRNLWGGRWRGNLRWPFDVRVNTLFLTRLELGSLYMKFWTTSSDGLFETDTAMLITDLIELYTV